MLAGSAGEKRQNELVRQRDKRARTAIAKLCRGDKKLCVGQLPACPSKDEWQALKVTVWVRWRRLDLHVFTNLTMCIDKKALACLPKPDSMMFDNDDRRP